MKTWSFQLYSARNFQPWDKILQLLGMLGYKEVEGFGGVYGDPVQLRTWLEKNGLTMPTGHFSIDMLENDFQGVKKIAQTIGIDTLICPHIAADARPSDVDGWKAFAGRLAKIGKTAKSEGFGFAWHNHDFEFKQLADGSTPQEHILAGAPDIDWEIDVAWIIRGGVDPAPWIERHGKRIIAVHVKDIAKPGEGADEDGWSDVGHGTVDWKALIKLLRDNTPAQHYVMEQDNPNDVERFAKRSIAAVNRF